MDPVHELERRLQVYQFKDLTPEGRWGWAAGAAAGLAMRLLYGRLPNDPDFPVSPPPPMETPEEKRRLTWDLAWKLWEEKGLDFALRLAAQHPESSRVPGEEFANSWLKAFAFAYLLSAKVFRKG